MRPPKSLTAAVLVVALAGCAAPNGGDASPSISASDPDLTPLISPTPSPPSVAPSPSAPASAEPSASDDLGAFTCELPIVDPATVAPPANYADVRVGSHEGYDRAVFEFVQGLPEYTLERATPPFLHDASGEPVEVDGSSFLRLTLRGGTRQTQDGGSSWDGPREFHPGLATLVDLVEGGDFEAQSTWYFGMNSEACVRILRLVGEGGTPRLVIDVEH